MNEPLAWYIAGPLIGSIVPLLLLLREKQFGISSSYRYLGSLILPRLEYFRYEKSQDKWQFHFALGLILSGLFSVFVLQSDFTVNDTLTDYGKTASTIYSTKNIIEFFTAGIFLGFGARYANGCTAGHCIMGVSLFSKASLLATAAFFAGGLITSFFIIPNLF